MDQWIFLTRSELLDAVAFDFQQYGTQSDLFMKLVNRMPGKDCRVGSDKGRSLFMISRGRDQPGFEIYEDKVGFFLIHLLETEPLPLETLADIAGLVFETAVVCGESSRGCGVWVRHGMGGFACAHCGHCCRDLIYTNDCSREDVLRWQQKGRDDILALVRETAAGRYEIWADPDTGLLFPACPWLGVHAGSRKQFCTIHEVKPATCRQYPFTPKHAAMTGCRGRFGR